MNRSKRSAVLIALGICMILGAAGLSGYNIQTSRKAGETSHQTLQMLQVEIPRENRNPVGLSAVEDPEGDLEMLVQGLEIPDHVLNPKMNMPEKEIDGVRYIGYLEIPALGLELPIISEESSANLGKAPCRYAGSVYQNNLVIAGHNYIQHFGYIQELSYGDVIRFVDVDGNVFRYEVVDLEAIPKSGVEAMLEGDWDLTLFTCNMSKASRITVRCVRTDK